MLPLDGYGGLRLTGSGGDPAAAPTAPAPQPYTQANYFDPNYNGTASQSAFPVLDFYQAGSSNAPYDPNAQVPGDFNARAQYYTTAAQRLPDMFGAQWRSDPRLASGWGYQYLNNLQTGLNSLDAQRNGTLEDPSIQGYRDYFNNVDMPHSGSNDPMAAAPAGYSDWLNARQAYGSQQSYMANMSDPSNPMSWGGGQQARYDIPASQGGSGIFSALDAQAMQVKNQQANSYGNPYGAQQAGNYNYGDLPGPIQTELGREQQQFGDALSSYSTQRAGQRTQYANDLQSAGQGMLSSQLPQIQDSLAQFGILQSGAYPEALAKQQANIYNQSILPQLAAFDNQTFSQQNQLPLQLMQNQQALQSGGIQRNFALGDQANQMAFQSGLANQSADLQQQAALLGLTPAMLQYALASGQLGGSGGAGGGGLGIGGLSGLGSIAARGGGAGGFASGNTLGLGPTAGAGGLDAGALGIRTGYMTPGGQFVPGGSAGNVATPANSLTPFQQGINSYGYNGGAFSGALGGAVGGGVGAGLGQSLLGKPLGSNQAGAGLGAAGLAMLLGGGPVGIVGAGLGGAFGGSFGGMLGGGLGGALNNSFMGLF